MFSTHFSSDTKINRGEKLETQKYSQSESKNKSRSETKSKKRKQSENDHCNPSFPTTSKITQQSQHQSKRQKGCPYDIVFPLNKKKGKVINRKIKSKNKNSTTFKKIKSKSKKENATFNAIHIQKQGQNKITSVDQECKKIVLFYLDLIDLINYMKTSKQNCQFVFSNCRDFSQMAKNSYLHYIKTNYFKVWTEYQYQISRKRNNIDLYCRHKFLPNLMRYLDFHAWVSWIRHLAEQIKDIQKTLQENNAFVSFSLHISYLFTFEIIPSKTTVNQQENWQWNYEMRVKDFNGLQKYSNFTLFITALQELYKFPCLKYAPPKVNQLYRTFKSTCEICKKTNRTINLTSSPFARDWICQCFDQDLTLLYRKEFPMLFIKDDIRWTKLKKNGSCDYDNNFHTYERSLHSLGMKRWVFFFKNQDKLIIQLLQELAMNWHNKLRQNQTPLSIKFEYIRDVLLICKFQEFQLSNSSTSNVNEYW